MKQLRPAAVFLALILSIPLLRAAASPFDSDSPDEIVTYIEKMVAKKIVAKDQITSLIEALDSNESDIKVRERAAWALGQLEVKRAVPALMKAAKHKGLLIRSAALDALTRLHAATSLPVIVAIAENDPILSLRQRATLALGVLRSSQAIKPLVKLSSDARPEIRGAAALAMAALHSKKNDFSEVMKEMEADADPYVKERARRGMEIVKRKNAAVETQLKSQDTDIRLFAALYFRQFGKYGELDMLKDAANVEADDQVRYELNQAVKAVKKRKPASKPAAKKKSKTVPANIKK